ncbi:membrane protein [Cellvibrio zantedeschiae]|uniref:Membrane protein n=1 Tax=Cellvibrio zantedeschiae TaxID=1237077 RepID=A0ABQ3BD92_9GAMM|nr:DUF2269 domain-containing protein [Cellvibrio zantedeschiae]GGY85250.1 membrane protein [Cellvibrio zantedeschiae]
MDNYLLLKYFHIFFATVLFGTGVGIAFFMLMAARSKNISVILHTARIVIVADWLFTAPAVVGQFITGVLLMKRLQYSFGAPWFHAVFSTFVFIGCCWIPVVIIQYRLRNLAKEAEQTGVLSTNFHRAMRLWILLGIPAFVGILVILWLMIFKPLAII